VICFTAYDQSHIWETNILRHQWWVRFPHTAMLRLFWNWSYHY